MNLMACNAAKGLSSQTSGMRMASAPVGATKSTRSGFYAPLSPCGRGAGGERPAAIALLLVLSFAALTQSADPKVWAQPRPGAERREAAPLRRPADPKVEADLRKVDEGVAQGPF